IVVAVTVSILDHLVNFRREILFVWKQPWSAAHALVTFNRYAGQASLLFIAILWQYNRNILRFIRSCKAFAILNGVYCIINSATSQFILILQVYGLWDNRKSVKHALIGGFIVCFTCSMIFVLITEMNRITAQLSYSSFLSACIITSKPVYVIGIWGGMTMYDLFVLALLVANTLSRPRRYDSEILTNLFRNGLWSFLVRCSVTVYYL
ncbi:hypothetical protein WOLCODRAFT_68658, partial [Wolfiporia cocos MD-104 SS10]